MTRRPLPFHCFALVVARRGDRFLVVRERKHGGLWYLPAGGLEPGESFADGALRETREEAGVRVVLEGILRVEHTPGPEASRLRVTFLARPADDAEPKHTPDDESLEARYVTLEELARLPLRSPEVKELFEAVAAGATVHPLELLRDERDG